MTVKPGKMDNLIELDGIAGYGKALITTAKLADFSRPKEIIYMDDETMKKVYKIIPKYEADPKDIKSINMDIPTTDPNYKPFKLKGDIIIAGTIPSPDIEMVLEHENENFETHVQFVFCDPEYIIAQLKDHPEKPAVAGVARIKENATSKEYKDSFKGYSKDVIQMMFSSFDVYIRIDINLNFDWVPILSVNPKIYELFSRTHKVLKIDARTDIYAERIKGSAISLTNDMVKMRDQAILLWYGLQLALLNPAIKERVKRETIPFEDSRKTSNRSGKKAPKKYIKRIFLGDISDIPLGKSVSHEMKESFWWVTGHFRNQKVKGGHKLVFIQGYWKGPLRKEAEKLYDAPRERELVIENGGN